MRATSGLTRCSATVGARSDAHLGAVEEARLAYDAADRPR